MIKTYRDNGAYGALLDEYERCVNEMKNLIKHISQNELTAIVDHRTTDTDCRSIQTVLTHVVQSGYNYAITIRKHNGEQLEYRDTITLANTSDYFKALSDMMEYTVQMMNDYPDMELEESDNSKKLTTRWGQMYNVEQLLEHAIVHILRHRRQIERFLLRLS